MTAAPDRQGLVEDLRRAMDELCAPDLTLARADVLRPAIAHLLQALREPAPRRERRGEGECVGMAG